MVDEGRWVLMLRKRRQTQSHGRRAVRAPADPGQRIGAMAGPWMAAMNWKLTWEGTEARGWNGGILR